MIESAKKRLDAEVSRIAGWPRAYSAEIIRAGGVSVNGKTALKPAFSVNEGDRIEIAAREMKYAGRGGYKLEKALDFFGISVASLVCADIGASTGGFTDCLLQRGAARVFAIDCGSNQLAEKLRADPRVVSMENTNIRDVFALAEPIDFAAVDLSFISATKILANAAAVLSETGRAVFLIKPQFEAEPGIAVKSRLTHKKILSFVLAAMDSGGLKPLGLTHSPIRGGSGNIEYLAYCAKNGKLKSAAFDIAETVGKAFDELK